MIHSFVKIYIYRIIISEATMSVTDKQVTSRKTNEMEAAVHEDKTVSDKRMRRKRGYPDGCLFNPEEHNVFST